MIISPFNTTAEEEAFIARIAAKVARMVRQDWRMAGASLDDAPATEIYDSCRDMAYDVLADRESTMGDLVDIFLIDITEAAVTVVMG